MAFRKKGFSAKQSRHMSRRMDDSLVGSHVQRGAHSRRVPNASSVAFSNTRASARATGSQLDAVAPASSSRETNAAYRQRTRQRGYIEGVQHRSRVRRTATFVVVALIVLAVAIGAGFLAFRGSVGSEMSLKNSDAADALVAVRSDEPYYALVTIDLGAAAAPLDKAGPDVAILAYVDRANNKLSLVTMPGDLQVTVDNAQRRLGDVAALGDAAVIRAVQNFAKVDISHYVKVGKGGVEGIVDALGGIEVVLDQVVDDPHAGDLYLPMGTYTLNGAGAVTYLRADNLALGAEDRLKNQASFAPLVLSRIFSGEGNFVQRLETLDSHFQTDLSLGDLEGLASWISGMAVSDIASIPLPGYMNSTAGVVDVGESRFICTAEDIAKIVETLEGGQSPASVEEEKDDLVDPSSFTVEVQNGTDIAGAATATAEALKQAGFRVEKSGNAEQQVYTETLVIYKANDRQGAKKEQPADAGAEGAAQVDEEGNPVEGEAAEQGTAKAAGGNDNGVGLARANTVINALGIGRAVEAGVYYSFDTDVLVIIGSDYKPVA